MNCSREIQLSLKNSHTKHYRNYKKLISAAVSNATVDPCDNFCRFTYTTNQAANLRRHQTFAEATETFNEIFIENEKSADKPEFLTDILNLWRACVEEGAIVPLDLGSLREILKLLGGWPVVEGDSWSAKNGSWRELQIKLSKIGFEGFIQTYYSDEDNVIVLGPASDIFSSLNDSSRNSLQQKMVKMAVDMGTNKDHAEREIQQAMSLQTLLDGVGLRDNNYTLSYQEDLRNLTGFFNTSTKEVMQLFPPHFNLSRNRLQLAETKLNELQILLDNAPIRDVFNYAFMRLIANLTLFSNNAWDRVEQCMDFVSTRFRETQEMIFVRKHLNKNTKKSIEELISLVKEKVKEEAAELNERSEMVQNRAYVDVSRIDSFSPSLGYPNEFFDDQLVHDYYENLEIQSINFFNGLYNYTRFKLANPKVPSFDFRESLRAYVPPDDNILSDRHISAVQLYIYLDKYTPKYMLYGELVSLIAKTISRSVTIKNRMHNNFFQTPQFKYDIKRSLERRIIEWQTQIAYSLYSDWLDNHGPEPTPRDLQNYTNRQIFWMYRSHLECHHENSSNQRWANNCGLRRDFKCGRFH